MTGSALPGSPSRRRRPWLRAALAAAVLAAGVLMLGAGSAAAQTFGPPTGRMHH